MSEKYESADLILKLYDLRREEKMREARRWWETFFPDTMEEILQALANPEASAKFRMVISFWEMGASLVNHGAIEEAMYNENSTEQFLVFAKIQPFLSDLRQKFGSPDFLKNFESLIMRMPEAEERITKRREITKNWLKQRKDLAKSL